MAVNENMNGYARPHGGDARPHIAIIGAGASGLTTAKQCLDEGFNVTIYERTAFVGGMWRYREEIEDGIASVMKSTIINSSKEISAFSDFPPPAEFPNFMHNTKMWEYLTLYAASFGAKKYTKLEHLVERCEPAADYEETGRWKVTVKDLKSGQVSSKVFDALVVANGHHGKPIIPSFPGHDKFKGEIMHSHSYRKPQGYEGKRVVVVGVGNSGCDLAVEMSLYADQTYLSTRRGAWVGYRKLPFGWPMDTWVLSRWFHGLTSVLPFSWRSSLLEFFMNFGVSHELYHLKPKHRLLGQHAVLNDSLPNCIISGRCQVKGNIQEFVKDGVIFEGDNGRVTKVDAVILATGYRITFPFLDSSLVPLSESNWVSLYKNIFQPSLRHPHTLAFIGLVQPVGSVFPIVELQSRWFAQLMGGKLKLPPVSKMMEDVHRTQSEIRQRYYQGNGTTRHTLQIDWVPYMEELASIIGARPNLAKYLMTDPKLWYYLTTGPCVPYQYRLEGPHPWPGAREAIIKTNERIRAPFATRPLDN